MEFALRMESIIMVLCLVDLVQIKDQRKLENCSILIKG